MMKKSLFCYSGEMNCHSGERQQFCHPCESRDPVLNRDFYWIPAFAEMTGLKRMTALERYTVNER